MEAPTYTNNDRIRYRIAQLEAKQPRAVREYLLGDPSALPRLQALDNQITALRAQLTAE